MVQYHLNKEVRWGTVLRDVTPCSLQRFTVPVSPPSFPIDLSRDSSLVRFNLLPWIRYSMRHQKWLHFSTKLYGVISYNALIFDLLRKNLEYWVGVVSYGLLFGVLLTQHHFVHHKSNTSLGLEKKTRASKVRSRCHRLSHATITLLLLLSSSSSSSSSSPLYRVFILIFLRQTMSLGNTLLQLFCCYCSWCLYRQFQCWIYCIFTLVLSEVWVQCPIWLFSVVLLLLLLLLSS